MRIALTRKQRKKGSGRKLSQYDYVAGTAGAQVRGDPLRTSGNPIQSGIKEPPPFNREALQPELLLARLESVRQHSHFVTKILEYTMAVCESRLPPSPG